MVYGNKFYLFPELTHSSLETPKGVIGKQCRPRSDAANSSTIFL